MSIQDIREARNIPVKIRGRVRYTGEKTPRLGTVVGTRGGYLRIRLDGDKRPGTYHPTWELEFLPLDCPGHGRGGSAVPCCARAGEYNGFDSGPVTFRCPQSCSCHD
jgi:hypothetical protein